MNWTHEELEKALGDNQDITALIEHSEPIVTPVIEPEVDESIVVYDALGSQPKFKSKTERRAWDDVKIWCPFDPSLIVRIQYESMTYKLTNGVRYTPDIFLYESIGIINGRPAMRKHMIEVKGAVHYTRHYGSGRDSRTKLKIATDIFHSEGDWYLLYPDKAKKVWVLNKFVGGRRVSRISSSYA